MASRESVVIPLLPPWKFKGACLGMDPDIFFPENGSKTRKAIAVCDGCNVRAECLKYAIDHEQMDGVWGGTGTKERRRMIVAERRKRAVAA